MQFESQPDQASLVMYVDLGEPPAWGSSIPFYESLLAANFFGAGTGGAHLGMNRDAGMVALSRQLPLASLSGQELLQELEAFVNLAERWKSRLEELAAQNAGPEGEPDREATGFRV